MGDSFDAIKIIRRLSRFGLSPAFAGLKNLWCFDPGACAPGFMLAPASQAKTALVAIRGVKARERKRH